jgi:UPF0271 protein
MRETVRAAMLRGVAIGAHPSYPDMKGFGRRELGLDPEQIGLHVTAQVRSLKAVCDAAGARLSHVKPHGALYNRATRDKATARAVAEAVRNVDASLVLLGLAGSEMTQAARHFGIPFAAEAFADRAYSPDLTLLPRDQPGAVIDDVETAAAAALRLVTRRSVITSDGAERALEAASLCVHGDNARALAILRAIRSRLESAGVRIQSFAS